MKKMVFVESEVVYVPNESDDQERIIEHYGAFGGRDFGSGTMFDEVLTSDISFEFRGRGALRRAKKCVKSLRKNLPDIEIKYIGLSQTTNFDTDAKE